MTTIVNIIPTRTQDELIAAGKLLGRKAEMTIRETGVWFNEVKLSGEGNQRASKNKGPPAVPCFLSARELCAATGCISYSGAKSAGQVVDAFPTAESQKGLSFWSCAEMLPAFKVLDKKHHARFISDMASGKPYLEDFDPHYKYHKPLTRADIRRQVLMITKGLDFVKNKALEQSSTKLVGKLDRALEGIPAGKVKKVRAAIEADINQMKKELNKSYFDAVHKEAKKMADTLAKPTLDEAEKLRAMAREDRDKYKEKHEQIKARLQKVTALMTESEYKLVLNCLHPDRAPEDKRDRYGRAFDIAKRLEIGVAWG